MTTRAIGFNHHAFIVESTDCPPRAKDLIAEAKRVHPNWRFSISQDHIDHHCREWYRNGKCEYYLAARFIKPRVDRDATPAP